MKKKLLAVLLAAVFAASAQAVTYLALGIDRSGSISAADFALQKGAYAAALGNAAVLPQDGSVAIGVWSFGETVIQHFALAPITGGNVGALVAAVNAMTQVSSGATALGPAIQTMQAALVPFANNANDKTIMDISTDGAGNTGIGQVAAATAAIAAGIDQINGLGVGGGANLNFVMGAGSFGVQVNDFGDFQAALEQKLRRETGQVPDAGSSLILMALGLAGLVGFRRLRVA